MAPLVNCFSANSLSGDTIMLGVDGALVKSFENVSENRFDDDGDMFGVGVSGVFNDSYVTISSVSPVSSINDRPTELRLNSS